MEQVLQRRIEIIDNLHIIKILKADDLNGKGPDEEENVGQGEAKGALGIRIETKEIMVFECKSLILATGGYTRVYSVSSSRISENYGEGIALAYEAGADLVDTSSCRTDTEITMRSDGVLIMTGVTTITAAVEVTAITIVRTFA